MFRLLLFFVLSFSTSFYAQQVSGIVTDEDQNPIPAVLVFNMKTEQKVYTNLNGEFTISSSPNEELRFIRLGFERSSKIVNSQDLNNPFHITIIRTIQEIEEVKVPAVRLTGDLNQDSRNLTKFDKVAQLQREVGIPGPPEKPRETPPPPCRWPRMLACQAAAWRRSCIHTPTQSSTTLANRAVPPSSSSRWAPLTSIT